MLENTFGRAPFSGIITSRNYNDNEIYSGMSNPLTGEAGILKLQQIDQLKVYIDASEKLWQNIKTGMEAILTTEIYPGKEFKGFVNRIFPTIDPISRTFRIELKIPNSDAKLRPGMFAKVELKLGEMPAILIPSSAVLKQTGTNERYVFVYEDSIATRKNIIPGKRFNEKIEVLDGLSEGEKLIVAGQSKLLSGDKVKPE